MTTTPLTWSIGVLLFPDHQLLDAAGPVDHINCHSRAYLEALHLPPSLLDKAPIITWHYISLSDNLDPVATSAGPLQIPSTTLADCPPLDYLLVPGADPRIPLSEATSTFLKARFTEVKGLLTVCTGSLVVAQTGLLDGLNVASNKVVLLMLASQKSLNKNVKWVGDRRFVRDGKVWSAGGVTAGLDLAAEFLRQHLDPELVATVEGIVEYKPNPAQPDPFAHILEGVQLG
ncbi:hypothetical protein CC2G_013683 [Coprinopsis cinerea AmutBmut pab1-1]|nr:hypothetical protein CC2G_013683 [Coprinopsis cinerea AmutBmut pab1-1]